MAFKIDKKQLKPVAMQVGAAVAGFVGASYAKPEIKNAMGSFGKYSDEVIAVGGTVLALASGKGEQGKLIRNLGVGVAVKGVLGIIDKYFFKKNDTGMQAPAVHLALPLADEPVEVLYTETDESEPWEEEEENETLSSQLITM